MSDTTYRALRVFQPKGRRRAPRRLRRTTSARPVNWLAGDGDPAQVNDLAIDLLLGYDPRRFL